MVFLGHKIPFNGKVLGVFAVLRQYLSGRDQKRYRCYYEEKDLALREKLDDLKRCINKNRNAGYKIDDDFLCNNFDPSFINQCIENDILRKLPKGDYDFGGSV